LAEEAGYAKRLIRKAVAGVSNLGFGLVSSARPMPVIASAPKVRLQGTDWFCSSWLPFRQTSVVSV